MSNDTQNNVPEWAKGEGWHYPEDQVAGHTSGILIWTVKKRGVLDVSCMGVRTFPSPEDARHIADCLIARKVLPTAREKALEKRYADLYRAVMNMPMPPKMPCEFFNVVRLDSSMDPSTVLLVQDGKAVAEIRNIGIFNIGG
jgi:hypothetical protein